MCIVESMIMRFDPKSQLCPNRSQHIFPNPNLWGFSHIPTCGLVIIDFPCFFCVTPTAPAGHVDARDGWHWHGWCGHSGGGRRAFHQSAAQLPTGAGGESLNRRENISRKAMGNPKGNSLKRLRKTDDLLLSFPSSTEWTRLTMINLKWPQSSAWKPRTFVIHKRQHQHTRAWVFSIVLL